jgi:hypothetical protein
LSVDMAPTRIDWVAEHCQLLRSISAEFKDTLPFRGLTIGKFRARRAFSPGPEPDLVRTGRGS